MYSCMLQSHHTSILLQAISPVSNSHIGLKHYLDKQANTQVILCLSPVHNSHTASLMLHLDSTNTRDVPSYIIFHLAISQVHTSLIPISRVHNSHTSSLMHRLDNTNTGDVPIYIIPFHQASSESQIHTSLSLMHHLSKPTSAQDFAQNTLLVSFDSFRSMLQSGGKLEHS